MDPLARLAEEPSRTGLLFDIDGVLAPIVPRPEDATVDDATRDELRRLHARYALVACISGRAGDDARRVVGVAALVYVGNHGLELASEAGQRRRRLQTFLADVRWDELENKGLSAALHYRNAPDEAVARAELDEIARRAREAGLRARYGRMVLEVLPPLTANKGSATRALLEQHDVQRALYAGDDTTDLDAFAALDGLELGVRVAVASTEGPEALRTAADVVLESQADVLLLLRRL